MAETKVLLFPGDVLNYRPDPSRYEPSHCREGMAIVNEHGHAIDTFWQSAGDHVLTALELATVELRFRLGEFHTVKYESEWLKYSEQDRQTVTSQHGLQRILYVRNGAAEDIDTQIKNAYGELRKAEDDLKSAGRNIEWAARKIAGLEAQRDA